MSGITVQLVFAFIGTRVPYHISEPAGPSGAAAAASIVVTASPLRSPFGNAGASSTSFSAAAQSSLRVHSATSSPSLGPSAPKPLYTTHQLLTLLAAIVEPLQEARPSASADEATTGASEERREETNSPRSSSAGSVPHRLPLLELLDYETMLPLDGAAPLRDESVLLVLCDPPTSTELVEALQLEWLEVYSGTHRPHQPSRPLSAFTPASEMEMAVCTTEERLRNVAHAQLALSKPVPLHMALLDKEFAAYEDALERQRQHLRTLKAAAAVASTADTEAAAAAASGVFRSSVSGVAERFPLLAELEPGLVSVLASDADNPHSANNEASLLMCEHHLGQKETLCTRVMKQLAKVKQVAFEAAEKERSFSGGALMQALQEHIASAEQERDKAEDIVRGFQAEMTRQLKAVRLIVAHITQLRNVIKKAKRDVAAIDLVLDRLSTTLQRPQLLERAEALLRRRVVLRRAARRQLLLLQETEYVDLLRDLQDFSQLSEVQQVLPAKVRWYLRAPLPSLQPAEDVVATLLDHALIDRDVDAAQELVERTRITSPHLASTSAETAQHVTETLLPIERLVQRAEKAEAAAAAYEARIAELEARLRESEMARELSSKVLENTETQTFSGSGGESSA